MLGLVWFGLVIFMALLSGPTSGAELASGRARARSGAAFADFRRRTMRRTSEALLDGRTLIPRSPRYSPRCSAGNVWSSWVAAWGLVGVRRKFVPPCCVY